MVRWQYKVVNIGAFFAHERLVDTLSVLGRDGWELVTIYDKASNWFQGMEKGFALFKRPVPEGTEPDGPWAAMGTSSEDALAMLERNAARVQKVLDDRRIDAPGAAAALADVVPTSATIDGAARLGADGSAGVIVVAERIAALWWANSRTVESVELQSFKSIGRDGLVLTLERNGLPIVVRAANEKYADAWIKALSVAGAEVRARSDLA
jgi:hypothetical protein